MLKPASKSDLSREENRKAQETYHLALKFWTGGKSKMTNCHIGEQPVSRFCYVSHHLQLVLKIPLVMNKANL